jgi:hypothetical protein
MDGMDMAFGLYHGLEDSVRYPGPGFRYLGQANRVGKMVPRIFRMHMLRRFEIHPQPLNAFATVMGNRGLACQVPGRLHGFHNPFGIGSETYQAGSHYVTGQAVPRVYRQTHGRIIALSVL